MQLRATVDKNKKGFAFLKFDSKDIEDQFIPPRDADFLFHGDRVRVLLSKNQKILELDVLEHKYQELVGRFHPNPNSKGGWVVYERKQTLIEIFISDYSQKIRAGDWVKVKLQYPKGPPFLLRGSVLKVFGPELSSQTDIEVIACEFGLVEHHPREASAEAEKYKEIEFDGRVDFQKIPFITIDGETARDFDDAVYVEKNQEGYLLWVAIADVSHYVKEGGALNQSAFERGTSVYFPEKAFHMLPQALSENLCSLKPHVPRLALVAQLFFDRQGKKLKTKIFEAVIKSQRRATYNEIQEEWQREQNENKKNSQWKFAPHFELYEILKRKKENRGCLDFNLSQADVLVDAVGEPLSIKKQLRYDSHRLIEEFMIAANEAVTEWMIAKKWPFLYRIHEEPSLQALKKFQELAKTSGANFFIPKKNLSQALSKFIQSIEKHPSSELLNSALLRSMKQAVYSEKNLGHFGLASQAYTHFTSPIRRYPDLVVHRVLKMFLHSKQPQFKKLEKEIKTVAEHCSYRERLAAEAEREAVKLKQVRLLLKHLGDEFSAKISGMIERGLFAQIEDPFTEGLISRDSLQDDFYIFDEKRMVFYGKRKKRMFRIGDKVKVKVARVSVEERIVDFVLVY